MGNSTKSAILWKVSSQVRQNVEAIRPNPKITSFSMELKTHREIKLTRHPIDLNQGLGNYPQESKGHYEREIDLSDVLCLEQWKNVEQLTLNTLVIENRLQDLNLDNKTHVDVFVKLLSMEDLGYLMEIFLDTPHHIQYRIKYKLHEDNNQNQFDMHQDDFYFRNPDTHQELSISRHKENGFTFSRVERTNASMGDGTR
ncbi:unnamed protein product [Caenorhabditis brenneri]